MPTLWGRKLAKEDLANYCGEISQAAGVFPFEYTDGANRSTRAVRLANAAGLEMIVLCDRGMGIYDLLFKGVQLGFKTPVGPKHPAFGSSAKGDFRDSWPAGFLTTCGLANVGSPCVDAGDDLPQHGRIASIPAENILHGGIWTADDDYELFVEGTLHESRAFGADCTLTRRISTRIGATQFWIKDTVENRGLEPAPFMLLQHINIGFPLLDENALLLLPKTITTARDIDAKQGVEYCTSFEPPVPGYKEQVFYHDCEAHDGFVRVAIINRLFDQGAGIGVYVQYKKEDYPNLVQWKMMRQGSYVCGIEPANCLVEGRAKERERGTLQFLEPGEKRNLSMEIGLLSGAKELDNMENEFEWVDDDTESSRA